MGEISLQPLAPSQSRVFATTGGATHRNQPRLISPSYVFVIIVSPAALISPTGSKH